MSDGRFSPPFIRALPRPDINVRQESWIILNEHILPMFCDIDEDFVVTARPHDPNAASCSPTRRASPRRVKQKSSSKQEEPSEY